ncbi:hypothetical protein [Prescottella equi]
MIDLKPNDKVAVWRLCKDFDMPRSRLVPVLQGLGVRVVTEGVEVYASREDLRRILTSAAVEV